MEKRHRLKTLPEFWDAVNDGLKTFEVRKDDRQFKVGEIVELYRYEGQEDWDAREFMQFRIRYILRGGQFGIEPGYVVLQLEDLRCPA
jgi:hypothetical protein